MKNKKEMTYTELVEKAKREIKCRTDYGTDRVPYRLCQTWLDGNQINLWTYWQGYQIKDIDKGVDILLVGQDWGNPWREGTEETVSRVKTDGFVSQLRNGVPFKIPYSMNNDITVYGVAHCGARGLSNVGGKEPMRKAWQNMAKEFGERYGGTCIK